MGESRPSVAVVQFPGSNCEQETARALAAAGAQPTILRWNQAADQLDRYEAVVVGGGFSYQDRVRAGVIAANEPVGAKLIALADAGRPVLGICNGAQVLVELGLVPGLEPGQVEMALAPNRMTRDGQVLRRGYYCTWTHLRLAAPPERCAWTRLFEPDTVIALPLAHGEGRFVTADPSVLDRIEANRQIVWQYCCPDGEVSETFPVNPNGSVRAIAGLCNPEGNVLALMPHPERASWLRQVPQDLPGRFGQARRAAQGDVAALNGPGPARPLFEAVGVTAAAAAS